MAVKSKKVRGKPVTIQDDACTLLRAADVVKMTKWSRTRVYSMIKSGELPKVTNGNSVRVPLLGLRAYIEARTSTASTVV